MAAEYFSIHTGQQVDIAVGKALALDDILDNTLSGYLKTTDINTSVAGLIDGKININNISLATNNTPGIITIGTGLALDANGAVSVDPNQYYNKTIVDDLMKGKVDKTVYDELVKDLELANNYTISITEVSTQDPSSSVKYYQLKIV